MNSRAKGCRGEESWRQVVGYEGYYEVSDMGQIRSVDRIIEHKRLKKQTLHSRQMKKNINGRNGYEYICLCRDGCVKQHRVHKLVVQAFLGEKPTAKHQVNHINGNKADNRAENLEWCTQSHNMKHAYANGLEIATWARPVIRVNDGKIYDSIAAAARDVDGLVSKVGMCCHGKRNKHKGYSFRFYEGVMPCR